MDHILDLALEFGLPVLWLGLFVAGLGLPIPEDIFLITGGVLTHQNKSSVVFAIAVLYSGVLVGDAIVYRLGSRYGEAVLRRKFIARLMTPARVERVRRYYARYGALTVFLARHVAGIRFPTFLMAGVSRMGFARFFFWDGLSALLSVPLWFWLGYAASENWEEIHKRISGWIAWVLAGLIVAVLAWKFRHRIARAFGRKKPEIPASAAFGPEETPPAVTRPVSVAYSPGYRMPLGAHVFPSDKYERTYNRCQKLGLLEKVTTLRPERPLTDQELGRVHTKAYLARVHALSEEDPMAGLTEFEVPCFPGVISAQATMARGTMMVTDWVLDHGRAARGVNLGGGFHHAFAAAGQGFCLFNDIALSILAALDRKRIARPIIVDTDVHQGNGTCHIFRDDPRVYTLDVNQANNYPIKQPASMNIGLPDDCGDDEYLDALTAGLADAMAEHEPDFVHYVAGGDPFAGDQLGGLAITKAGLQRRDRLLLLACAERDLPLLATLAGGYAENTEDLVEIHSNLVAALLE